MLIPYLGATYGGTSKIVNELVTSLGKLDISIDLVTTDANDTTNLKVPLQSWLTFETHRLQYFPCWHRRDLVLSSSLARWLMLHVNDYDLVHTHTIFAPIVSFTHWVCRLQNVPYIAAPHGMLEPWALSYKASKKRIYFDWIEKAGLKKASAIQVTATPEGDHVNALGFDQTVLVHNGLHQQDYETSANLESFYQNFPITRGKTIVLFLGRVDPKKGLDLLAPAFSKVKERFPKAHLVVAGPDSIGFTETAKKYFVQAGCLDAVTFTGMIKGKLKKAALEAASVYVAPSYSEGFSMSVLEGMASSLPCVITTGCNFPEAAAARAAHVVEISSQAIATALLECLRDEAAAQVLGSKAREFILENYTWDQAASKLKRVYSSILQPDNTQRRL